MNSTHPDRKEKIKHEFREMLELFLYLAFFFCALAIYDMLLLKQYNVEYLTIAFALINAAVITKVIMIGEYAKLGKRYEYKALLVSAVWKAFVFGLLVFAFHIVEEVIKRLIHGADLAKVTSDIRFDQFAGPQYRCVLRFYSPLRMAGISAFDGRGRVPSSSISAETWRKVNGRTRR